MIEIKTARQIGIMREGAVILKSCFREIGKIIDVGVTTLELERAVVSAMKRHGASPSFKNYRGFPYSICASKNDCIIHGYPDSVKLKASDILSVDIGVFYRGFHVDAARTYCLGEASAEARRLVQVTKESFFKGAENARPDRRLQDIGSAVANHAETNGYTVVKTYVGHGIGRALHESPDVPNFGTPGRGIRLAKGMTIAVEPMVNEGLEDVKILKNGIVMTADGSLSAHYENTIAITNGMPEILTLEDEEFEAYPMFRRDDVNGL